MRTRLALGLIVAAVLLTAPTAAAHANYLSSDPARNASLFEAPKEIVVTLTEEVDPAGSGLELRDIDGNRIDTEPTRFELGARPVLRLTVPADLPPGAYSVTWKALSTVDGHVTGGSFGFAVGGFDPPTSEEPREELAPLSATARAITYTGYALALGALATLYMVALDRTHTLRRRHAATATTLGAAAITLGTLILAIDTWRNSGLAITALVNTRIGQFLLLRLLLAFTAAVTAWTTQRKLTDLGFAATALLVLAAGWTNATFAHSADQGLLAVTIDFLHLVSVSVWLGGLAFFLAYLRRAGRAHDHVGIHSTGLRFSRLAIFAVAVLALTGVLSSLLILGTHVLEEPRSLLASPYGRILTAKIALAAGMVALAAINRYLFLGSRPGDDRLPFGQGPEALAPATSAEEHTLAGRRRTHQFQRSVAAEATLGALVLLLAGFLTAISPPETADIAPPDTALRVTGQSREIILRLVIDPKPVAGQASNFTFELLDKDTFEPITEAQRVRLFIIPEADPDFGQQEFFAQATPNGTWTVGSVLLTQAGNHTAETVVSTDTLYEERTRTDFTVRAPGTDADP